MQVARNGPDESALSFVMGGDQGGIMQTAERELGKYLIKARRAEHLAAKFAPDSHDHEGWHKIAEGYRQLAEQAVPKQRGREIP
jgi:hypothetical protein